MSTINQAKEAAETSTPLFLFDFIWPDGPSLSVCSHAVTHNGVAYLARVKSQQIDPIQALSANGIDIPGSVRLTLADANKDLWQIQQTKGFRGARLKVTFGFYDFKAGTWSDDVIVPFVGRCWRPETADDALIVTATYILAPGAKSLPTFILQDRCPKLKPRTAAQVALKDVKGSPYYACGSGTTDDCGFTPEGCATNNDPLRGGWVRYQVPPGSHSREFNSGNWLDLVADQGAARYGDYAPIVYGTAWVDCVGLGAWPDGNSTRGEVIVCEGRPEDILKVTAEDEVLPASNNLNYHAYRVADPLFRYDVVANGDRTGRLNPDSPWNGNGDPQGSLCKLEWVVYRKLTGGQARVRALIRGPRVHAYARIASVAGGVVTWVENRSNRDCAGNGMTVRIFGNSNEALNGTHTVTNWTYGPPGSITLGDTTESGEGGFVEYEASSDRYAWAILDVLRRIGGELDDIDIESFIVANESHSRMVSYTARYSNTYASGVTYAAGDVVTFAGKNYASLQDGNVGNQPDLNEDWWAVTDAAPAAQPTGVTSQHPKYRCSLVIRQRRQGDDVLTGLLRGCDSHLTRNLMTGQIALCARGSLAEQQPAAIDGSNYDMAIAGGRVAYRFSESSILRLESGASSFRGVARAATSIPNVVTIPFVSEDNDYSGDSAQVRDVEDIALMGQEVTGNWSAEGCTALDRANRVGSIFLATQIDGAQWELQTTAKAVKLRAGDLIAFDNAKHGFEAQLARVMRIAPVANWRTCTIQVAEHDDAWYADDYSRGAASGSTGPRQPRTARPPRAWCPNEVAPATGDPLYAETEKTFALGIAYGLSKAGTPQPTISVRGRSPVNVAAANLQPPVLRAQGSTTDSGGSIAGGGSVYCAALASLDADGRPGPLSNVCQIVVAQEGDDNTLVIPVSYLDVAGAGYAVYVGRSAARLTRQTDVAGGAGRPAAITVTALVESGEGAPDVRVEELVIRPRIVRHYGPWAASISEAGAGTLKITGAGWPAHQWQGCDCSILAKADGSELPVLNFHVTDSTADTLTVTPDPAELGVAAGDLLGMMTLPTVDGLQVSDARWQNTLSGGGGGLAPHAEKGAYWRVVAGTGRGYRYLIADNDATSITVEGPWVVTPDATSRGVIEEATELAGTTVGIANGAPGAALNASINVSNYPGKVLLIEAVLRGAGLESAPTQNPVRAIYVAGSQGPRLVTESCTQLATDGLVLLDTSGVARPAATTLAAAITDTVSTALTLANGAATVNGTDILAGTERLRIVSGGGTANLVVKRGAAGTTAATHANGAAVTIPGGLTFTCLPSSDTPGVKRDLQVHKVSTDINYGVVLAGGSDTFDSGATSIILPDHTDAAGMADLVFPG